jgi:hypothetical protein
MNMLDVIFRIFRRLMEKNITTFESDRYFTMFDFKISLGQLLLRSQKTDNSSNVDIIFMSTSYVQLPTRLHGIHIKKLNEVEINKLNLANLILSSKYDNVFEVTSNGGNKYYVVASVFAVFENDLAFHETSLGGDLTGKEKRIQ